MSHLFSELKLRGLTMRNRIAMSPMCMYSGSGDGCLTDWHMAHYLGRAIGGVGLVITEATAVQPGGRISYQDLGLWEDSQIEGFARLAQLVRAEGAALGVQLAHAGRKAWSSSKGHPPAEWSDAPSPVAPSALAHAEDWQAPRALEPDEINGMVAAWRAAAVRARAADLDLIEIHAAHGYLIHEFLSPLSNRRRDEYGGSAANRMRFLLHVTEAVREVWPEEKPLFVRVSATDWYALTAGEEGGLTPDDLVIVARELRARGVDLIDCSSGGLLPTAPPRTGPGYQVPFASQIRREAGMPTAAVGLITSPELAEAIVRNGRADLVVLGRELLRHPHWPLDAARSLGHEIAWPRQYQRARKP